MSTDEPKIYAQAKMWLTDEEQDQLVIRLLTTRPMTTEELLVAFKWANGHKFGHLLLTLVLSGEVGLDVKGEEIWLYNPKIPEDEKWQAPQSLPKHVSS